MKTTLALAALVALLSACSVHHHHDAPGAVHDGAHVSVPADGPQLSVPADSGARIHVPMNQP